VCFWKYVDGFAVPELFADGVSVAGDLDQQSVVRIREFDWAERWWWIGKRCDRTYGAYGAYGSYRAYGTKRTYGTHGSKWAVWSNGTYGC